MSQFSQWMAAASGHQKQQFARGLGVTLPYLYQLARGTRSVNSLLAIRMERIAKRFTTLPPLHREKLNAGCAQCDFAKRCRGGDA